MLPLGARGQLGPLGVGRRTVAGPVYDADANLLFALMTAEPDEARKLLISNTIVDLKDAGCWSLIDEMWFMAAHDAQAGRLGWKRHRDLTAVNAPTFEVDRGYAGNGTTSYLNTNFVPSVDGVNYTLNDASFGVYSRTNISGSYNDMGVTSAGVNQNWLQFQSGAVLIATINAQSSSNRVSVTAPATSLGLAVARRTASDAIQAFVNGGEWGTGTQLSTALPAEPFFIGARNSAGSPINFSTRQYAFSIVAAGMSAQQQADLYTIVHGGYLTSIGAQV